MSDLLQVVLFALLLTFSLCVSGKAISILDETSYVGVGIAILIVGCIGSVGSYILALLTLFKLIQGIDGHE